MSTRALAGVGAAVILAAVAMPPAHAETTYRYWSYWVGGDAWSYSARGPGFRVPPDAGVEGYRFVVSPKDGSQASPPTTASTYEQLCPGQPAPPAGQKRVAVVLDFGAPGIAPVGETPPATSVQCMTVDQGATGLQTLQTFAQLRFHSSGLICGIAGFPATECPGETSHTAGPSPSPSPTVTGVVPSPVTVATAAAPLATPSVSIPASPTPAPTVSSAPLPSDMPSAVALSLQSPAPPKPTPATPAWIAAIGVTLIAGLIGLALLARRGREE